MIITVMGTPCSGKSTIAKMLAKHYGYQHYSVGDLRRMAAKNRGLTLAEYNTIGEGEEDTDTAFEEHQKRLGETEDDFVIDGRMSALMIPHSISIYLDADISVRAQRLLTDAHHLETEPCRTVEEAQKLIEQRVASGKVRYKRHYDFDPFDPGQYDITLDTTELTLEQVRDELIKRIEAFLEDHPEKRTSTSRE